MNEIYFLISIVLINLVWVISPGPWFLIVVKNALKYWKSWWFFTWIWIALWDLTHMIYCFLGIWVLISNSLVLFTILKFIWAWYLVYLWIKSFLSKSKTSLDINEHQKILKAPNYKECFKNWYLITIVNPKATLMFLWIFSTILTPEIHLFKSLLVIFFMFLNPIIWFLIVSIFFNNKKIKNLFLKYELIINKIFWIFLTLFWILIILK